MRYQPAAWPTGRTRVHDLCTVAGLGNLRASRTGSAGRVASRLGVTFGDKPSSWLTRRIRRYGRQPASQRVLPLRRPDGRYAVGQVMWLDQQAGVGEVSSASGSRREPSRGNGSLVAAPWPRGGLAPALPGLDYRSS